MKKKLPKILFVISLLPYILSFLYALYNAVFGTTFIFSDVSGIEAFILTFILMLVYLFAEVTIIPLCAMYQICYLLRIKSKVIAGVSTKKYIGICCILGTILMFIWMLIK